MSLSEKIQKILELQPNHSSVNTPEMQMRGKLLRELLEEFRVEVEASDLQILDGAECSDGIGNKSEIPWIRLYSNELSPKASIGWYVVLLFNAEGRAAYLTLAHGSTKLTISDNGGVSFPERSDAEVAQLMTWGRTYLPTDIAGSDRLTTSISLDARRSALGSAYEKTSLIAFGYESGSIPNDEVIKNDLKTLTAALSALYDAVRADPAQPGIPSPEVESALDGIADQAGRRASVRGNRQGFALSATQKKVVEEWAVAQAIGLLKSMGWKDSEIKDVGATESYDLHCESGAKKLFVEVKGTTSAGETVILTRNEVALHKREFPNNALIVCSKIALTKGDPPVASGGELRIWEPWSIDNDALRALGYEYKVPSEELGRDPS